ncbi:hypothetical protein AOL_s00091g29 [Orbilia oligospora ATCC 24927]|uniref:Uncharacterized protein n=1 Tax=Arthrobotrys oligospora (strain ATCC 24927 / CBS 115.81 / DSM 1491) TaxID=756982 RepID=G1XHX7_ARTOA|nr:hypothetical protein AOL_s00091g29 [Orbilia oligospora ATCC 24927]EGX47208.1 hypothetical protein AOL_s00091g29 [Orbilia oligospora ATCC 24927]
MSTSDRKTKTTDNLNYILARRTFADVWLALSVDLHLTIKHVAAAGKRIFAQLSQKFGGNWLTEPIDLIWARGLCNAYNIPLKSSVNLRPDQISTEKLPCFQPTEEEISELRRFLADFLSESIDNYSITSQKYDDAHMQRFGIEKATITIKNFLMADTYYPRKFGLLKIFNPGDHVSCFEFIFQLAIHNPFIHSRNPPFLNILRELPPKHSIEGRLLEHPQAPSIWQTHTRVAKELTIPIDTMQPEPLISRNISESPRSGQSTDHFKTYLQRCTGVAAKIRKRDPRQSVNPRKTKRLASQSILQPRGVRSKLATAFTPQD